MLTDAAVIPILLATDLEASKRFWADVIGLPVDTADDAAVTFAWGGAPRLRLTASTEGTKDTQTQLAFIVADVRAEVAALRAAGVTIEEYDTDELKTLDGVADQGDALVAYVTDPGGNVFGVEQPK